MGTGTIVMGSDPSLEVQTLPTGVFPIDVLLQGGLPRNRSVEIYGDFSTLKSYIAYRAIATTQANGGVCFLVDTESTFEPDWAARLGVDLDALIYRKPRTGEEAVDEMEVAISNEADLVVLDSIAAILPQAEADKRMHKEHVQPARTAALMSAALRKLTSVNSRTALLFINQTRMHVGVTFGDPLAIPGGKALSFYASHRLSFRKAGRIKREVQTYEAGKRRKGRETTGMMVRATVEKSKISRPHREVMLTFDFETGEIDEVSFLVSVGVEHGIIDVKGSTWVMGTKRVRGAEAFAKWLRSDAAAQRKIKAMVDPYSGSQGRPSRKVVVRRKKS